MLELETLIRYRFIGDADMEAARDAAADAMISALGDRWSYYIPAEKYASYQENKDNAYVGIGITISQRTDGTGYDIVEVTPGSSAQEGGVLPGDILVEADGQDATKLSTEDVRNLIRGKKGTEVSMAVLREGKTIPFTLERREIRVQVASGQLVTDTIGLVTIANFNTNCADETISAAEELIKQGAKGLIFDVRNNGGGYVKQMLKVLDYLLPKGVIYRDLDYMGNEGEEVSDADCVELPMAVLVNGNSYSAAEFFAAALKEFDWATVVGQPTTGKGHYQNTFRLTDGSAVNISTGKYFTPSGVNLTDVGGLTPDVVVEVDAETAALIYAKALDPAEDPQIQAAVAAVEEKLG